MTPNSRIHEVVDESNQKIGRVACDTDSQKFGFLCFSGVLSQVPAISAPCTYFEWKDGIVEQLRSYEDIFKSKPPSHRQVGEVHRNRLPPFAHAYLKVSEVSGNTFSQRMMKENNTAE